MKYDKDQPYNNLPLLPPNAEIETKEILKKAIKANKALAKLVGSSRQLPNQSMLINSIGLQEAKMSSEIENIITTNDELYKAFSSDKIVTDANTKEVLHYQEALWHGYQFVSVNQIITTNLFVKLFNIVKESNAGIRNTPGTKISNKTANHVVYTPPEGESIIRDKLKNLEDFINDRNDDIDPLIKMAIIHYQFEAIHPFSDGNGRTGRILNILYLLLNDLLEVPILYLSKYIIDNKTKYYEGLRHVTEQNKWTPWILYMLEGIESTAVYTQSKIDSITQQMEDTGQFIKNRLPDIYTKELLEIIFQQPYCKRKFIEEANIVKRKTAGIYLSQLEKIGVMKSVKIGKEKLYINTGLFEILKK